MPATKKRSSSGGSPAAPAAAAAAAAADKSPAKRAKPAAPSDVEVDMGAADVVIVSSKACQAFGKRATELSRLIKEAKPGAKVVVDERKKESSKPDVGSFVVQVKGGDRVVELLHLARPFPKLKALDIPAVAKEVVEKL